MHIIQMGSQSIMLISYNDVLCLYMAHNRYDLLLHLKTMCSLLELHLKIIYF